MTKKTVSANEIANALLDRTGNAMESGDFDAFAECFALPLVMETFQGTWTVHNRQELAETFQAVRNFRRKNCVVEVIRENISADYRDDTTIAATHVARMFQERNILFGRPYPAYSMIRKRPEGWQIQLCQYAIEDPGGLNRALSNPKEKAPRDTAAPRRT